MGKLDPNFREPVNECILNYIMVLYDEIEHITLDNHDEVILKVIDNYYKNRLDIKNIFSEDFLNNIKKDLIMEIWDVNKESFKIKESTKNKIFKYLMDNFIEEFTDYAIEIED